ncbi:hypothetical protein H5410_039082 [Solanum commersonii]|uniref:Uncharacterized protein n=1 Tax=Solanum commersonii TaxID=4109 RepID=A0A9J5YCF2_SOLCO|nr:hypothetical protein H5410_039082 [Solanum commersonii]
MKWSLENVFLNFGREVIFLKFEENELISKTFSKYLSQPENVFLHTKHTPSINRKIVKSNTVADHLAKLATMRNELISYGRQDQFPSGVKSAYLLDKMQLPSIRISYGKANFFVKLICIAFRYVGT